MRGAEDAGAHVAPPDRRGRRLHGAHDVLVAGAAAQVAFQAVADLLGRGIGRVLQQFVGGEDHPRRAEPALQAVLVPERFLDRVQRAGGPPALRWW